MGRVPISEGGVRIEKGCQVVGAEVQVVDCQNVGGGIQNAVSWGMRHIIRSMKTGGYFRGGAWVAGRDDAQDFGDTARVIAASIQYKLEGVEMIVQKGDKPCAEKDITLRISPWWKQSRESEKETGQFGRASS